MYELLMAVWLSVPAYPLNPIAQDTINPINFHVTIGLSGPNNLVGSGPEVTGKCEMRIVHPIVVRAGADYRFGSVQSHVFPHGEIHTASVSADVLYYRGTNRLTGYLGLGASYSAYSYRLTPGAADSLARYENIQEMGMKPMYGIRLTMGLRFNRVVSLEIGVTESRPYLESIRRYGPSSYSVSTRRIRLSDVRVTVGYLWTIRGPHH